MSVARHRAQTRPALERRPLGAGQALPLEVFSQIRKQLLLRHCKWDPQVGDTATLAHFPLLLSRAAWTFLSSAAEQLAAETLAIENALLFRPDLHRHLGIPRRLRMLLRRLSNEGATPTAARVMRFDFHFTDEGWRISEINSDVPGGFTESSIFPALVAQHVPEAEPAGDPASVLVQALAKAAGGRDVLLLSSAGFMEDQQVIAGLARRLGERGIVAHQAQIQHLQWREGLAHLDSSWHRGPIGAIMRFHQCEWLGASHRDRARWTYLFVGGNTPVCNPIQAVLSESKRLPLVWDQLDLEFPAWRRFLPETRELRHAPWKRESANWLLKTAYCNTGDTVSACDLISRKSWRATQLDAMVHPRHWIAQRRFQIVPVDTPLGRMYPCVGVYVVDERACGIYGRLSFGSVINYQAVDTAVLIEKGLF